MLPTWDNSQRYMQVYWEYSITVIISEDSDSDSGPYCAKDFRRTQMII